MRELRASGKVIRIEDRPLIMGILNVTPDSFSDGGKYAEPDAAIARALVMLDEGADIIDVGGESTRPGSETVSLKEELRRVEPVVKGIFKERPKTVVSIDTRRPEVAERALSLGAVIVNDVGGMQDPKLRKVARSHGAAVVIMHMKGDPKTMQEAPRYDDLLREVTKFLWTQAEQCVSEGFDKGSIIVDPGIGFGKRPEDNLMLLRELKVVRDIGYPVMVGVSRKSFIERITGRKVEERLAGSVAANVVAMLNGADILRVHDVKETRDAIAVARAILSAPKG